MKRTRTISTAISVLLAGVCMFGAVARAQVSPAEIRSSNLKAAEEKYFPQLKQLNKDIRSTRFPFAFVLSRYVGVDPDKQTGLDTRGIEFVLFESRVVLKISGNYNAAYTAEGVTENERAAHTMKEVVAPILGLVVRDMPADMNCNGVGFEISYHVRTSKKNFEYEGKEALVVVFDKPDALEYNQASDDDKRQEILNRAEIYVNGARYGLALNAREPLDLEATTTPAAAATAPGAKGDTSTSAVNMALLVGQAPPAASTAAPATPSTPAAAPATQADVDRAQSEHQAELDNLVKTEAAKLHFVDYAPPSFAVFQNRLVLQITLRNTLSFAPGSSIYKRAAQSFDLFLAPLLKDLLDKLPANPDFDNLDISVLNRPDPASASTSEAVEFVCSRRLLRRFSEAEITNQQVIDQSIVLVNSVRIALNLQQVE